jgi:hypothetical protein
MQDALHEIDVDYYRSVLLLIARAKLAELRQERSAPESAWSRGQSLPLARADKDTFRRPLVRRSATTSIFLPPHAFGFDITAFHHKTVQSLYSPHDEAVADEPDSFPYGGSHGIQMHGHHPTKVRHFL